jgi:hypothetical protein
MNLPDLFSFPRYPQYRQVQRDAEKKFVPLLRSAASVFVSAAFTVVVTKFNVGSVSHFSEAIA